MRRRDHVNPVHDMVVPSSSPHLALTDDCNGLSRSTRPGATPFHLSGHMSHCRKRIRKNTYMEGRAQGTVVAEKQLRPLHCCVHSALGRVRRTVHNGRRVRLCGRLELQPVVLGVEQPLGRPVLAGALGATHCNSREGERAGGGWGGRQPEQRDRPQSRQRWQAETVAPR